jgi:GT2 family glycosyltransferase
MDASIVIATRNRRDLLARTLRSIERMEPAAVFETVVADHGSSDGTAELVETLALPVRRVDVPFRHESIADPKNAGAEAATGDILIFLDSGMVCPEHFLRAHLAAHRRTRGSFVAGAVVGWDSEDDTDAYWRAVDTGELPPVPDRLADPRSARWRTCADTQWMLVWGANMSLPRRAFLDGGGFDTGMRGWGWDDIELAYRLGRSGLRMVFSDDAWAVHYPHPRSPLVARMRTARVNWLHAYARHRAPELETWEVCGYWEHTECQRRLRAAAGQRVAFPAPARTEDDGDRVLFGFDVPKTVDPRDTFIVPPNDVTDSYDSPRLVESYGLRTWLADGYAGTAVTSSHLLDFDWSISPDRDPVACGVLRELGRLAPRVEVRTPRLAPAVRARLGRLAAIAALPDFDVIEEAR